MRKILEVGHGFPVSVGKSTQGGKPSGDAVIFCNIAGKLYAIPETSLGGWKSLFDFMKTPQLFQVKASTPGVGFIPCALVPRPAFMQGAQVYYSEGVQLYQLIDIGTDDWCLFNLRIGEGKSVRLVDEGSHVVVYRF